MRNTLLVSAAARRIKEFVGRGENVAALGRSDHVVDSSHAFALLKRGYTRWVESGILQASELLSRQLVPPKSGEGGSLGDGGCSRSVNSPEHFRCPGQYGMKRPGYNTGRY